MPPFPARGLSSSTARSTASRGPTLSAASPRPWRAHSTRLSFTGWCVSRPSSHIQTWFTSSLRRGSSRYATVPRDSTYTLQPFAHPVQTLGDLLRNQTRLWKRKSRLRSAPTGQMSTVLPLYFESSG